MTAPGMSRRDSQIVDLLAKGLSVDRITELGAYRGTRTAPAWTRADVARLAAAQRPSQPRRKPKVRRRRPAAPATPTAWAAPSASGATREVVLTPARATVLTAICEGKSLDEVAEDFQITNNAAKERLRGARLQLGARDTVHAVVLVLTGRVRIRVAAEDGRATNGQRAAAS